MKITNMRLELTILGFQSLIWLVLFAFGFLDNSVVENFLRKLSSSGILAVFFTLGVLYPLGILVDRIADYFLTSIKIDTFLLKCKLLNNRAKDDAELDMVRNNVQSKIGDDLIPYSRGNLRIVRGSIINYLLIAIGAFFCKYHADSSMLSSEAISFIMFSSLLLLIISLPIFAIVEGVNKLRKKAIDA